MELSEGIKGVEGERGKEMRDGVMQRKYSVNQEGCQGAKV